MYDDDCIYLLKKYVIDLLHGTGLNESIPASMPMFIRKSLSKMHGVVLIDPAEYIRVIVSLQYLTLV